MASGPTSMKSFGTAINASMLGSASSWAYGPAPSKNCGCGCRGQPELHLTAAVAAHDSGEEQMTRCQPNRSTGALDYGRSTPKSQSPGPLPGFDRIHAGRSMSTSLSSRASTSPPCRVSARKPHRVCPTLPLVCNASVRQHGRCERAARPLPGLSYPLEHQSPGRPCQRYIANEKKGVVDGHVDKRRGHANQS